MEKYSVIKSAVSAALMIGLVLEPIPIGSVSKAWADARSDLDGIHQGGAAAAAQGIDGQAPQSGQNGPTSPVVPGIRDIIPAGADTDKPSDRGFLVNVPGGGVTEIHPEAQTSKQAPMRAPLAADGVKPALKDTYNRVCDPLYFAFDPSLRKTCELYESSDFTGFEREISVNPLVQNKDFEKATNKEANMTPLSVCLYWGTEEQLQNTQPGKMLWKALAGIVMVPAMEAKLAYMYNSDRYGPKYYNNGLSDDLARPLPIFFWTAAATIFSFIPGIGMLILGPIDSGAKLFGKNDLLSYSKDDLNRYCRAPGWLND